MRMSGGQRRGIIRIEWIMGKGGPKIMKPVHRRRQIPAKTDTGRQRLCRVGSGWHMADLPMGNAKGRGHAGIGKQRGKISARGQNNSIEDKLCAVFGCKLHHIVTGRHAGHLCVISDRQIGGQMRHQPVRPDGAATGIEQPRLCKGRSGWKMMRLQRLQKILRPALCAKQSVTFSHARRCVQRHNTLPHRRIRRIRQP